MSNEEDVLTLDEENQTLPIPPPVPKMNFFQKYLSLIVLFAMAIGILIGYFAPSVPEILNKAQIAQVSIPIAILLWGIILPMMIQINFASIWNSLQSPKAIFLTVFINYGIQPFSMYGLAYLFFKVIFGSYFDKEVANGYLIGSLLLGGAPCTAMVFVWSSLMNGNSAYTLTQVAVNDLLLIVLYSPTVKLLAGTSNINLPWDTLLYSVGFFVVIPLILGILIRFGFSRHPKGMDTLNKKILPFMDHCAMGFLVLMVILLFISQASTIVQNLLHIVIIAIPLLIQTILIWGIAYVGCLLLKIPYSIAGPSTLIACSNFFEMAVAIAISLYGPSSPAALATVVGVLIEVPVMLLLVWINNRTQSVFERKKM